MVSDKLAFIRWLNWMKKASPELYALFYIRHPEIVNALNEKNLGFEIDWSGVIDVGSKFISAALPIYTQKVEFDQQLKLAKLQAQLPASLQPQNAPQYAPTFVPQNTQQQYAPATQATIKPTLTTSAQIPLSTATAKEPLVIRIEKSELKPVQNIVKEQTDFKKYIPFAIAAIVGIALISRR